MKFMAEWIEALEEPQAYNLSNIPSDHSEELFPLFPKQDKA